MIYGRQIGCVRGVQELGRQVFRFDMDPSDMDCYRSLWAAVSPPDQKDVDAALLLG